MKRFHSIPIMALVLVFVSCKPADKGAPAATTERSEVEFNTLVEDLTRSLDKPKVGEREKTEQLGALGGMKGEIVGA
jgi:hypothetical protein